MRLALIPLAVSLTSPALAQDTPSDLRAEILALDAAMFEAFNTCDGEGFGRFIAPDVEFYHDLDGLSTDRDGLIEAVNTSICNNFRRQAEVESFEVWPVPGHGAIHTGTHHFINYGAETPHGSGRFLHVWHQGEQGWQITRIMSFDHGPYQAE